MPAIVPDQSVDRAGDKPGVPRRPSAGGFTANLVASALILGLNVATGVILARAFDPSERGEVALVLIWPGILAALAQLGLPEAATFLTARGTSRVGQVLGSGLVIATLRAVAVIAITAAILPFVLGSEDDEVLVAGYIYLGFIPGHAYNLLFLGVINGQERYGAVAALRVLVIAAAAIPMFVVFALGDLSLMVVVLLYVGAQAITFVTSVVLLRGTWRELGISRSLTRKLLHYGVRAHIGTISASLNLRADQLIVSLFLSTRDLGLYVVGATLATLTSVIGATVGYVVVPVMAGAKDDSGRIADARRFTALTLLASAAITLPLVLLTPQVIRLFFGADYVEIADVARVLLIASISFSTARCLEAILRAIGIPWQASLGELIALGVTGLALAALIPPFGLMGAALASLLAYFTSLAWMLRVTARQLHVAVSRLVVPNTDDLRLRRL